MAREPPASFEKFLNDLSDELEDIEKDGYRLRRDLGDTHDYFLQAGGDFNAYLDSSREPTLHEINSSENWSEESNQIFRLLDDQYDL